MLVSHEASGILPSPRLLLPGQTPASGRREHTPAWDGTGTDRFWLEVLDKKGGNVIDDMSTASPATDHATEILGGNIVVPHGSGGKKRWFAANNDASVE